MSKYVRFVTLEEAIQIEEEIARNQGTFIFNEINRTKEHFELVAGKIFQVKELTAEGDIRIYDIIGTFQKECAFIGEAISQQHFKDVFNLKD